MNWFLSFLSIVMFKLYQSWNVSLWTEPVCLFKQLFELNCLMQMSQLKGFVPSWSDETCCFKIFLYRKLEEQISHLKDFNPSWTDLICLFKLLLDEKSLKQMSHCKDLCTDTMCSFILNLLVNINEQMWHWNDGGDLSLLWIVATCLSKSPFFV